jgi:hypothetical protein
MTPGSLEIAKNPYLRRSKRCRHWHATRTPGFVNRPQLGNETSDTSFHLHFISPISQSRPVQMLHSIP